MRRAIYPGSFDPITYGHLDVMERGLRLFDEVIVVVARNRQKAHLFSMEDRVEMVREGVKGIRGGERIQVMSLEGLLVECAEKVEAQAIIRGLRAVSDFEYEFQMALMNRNLKQEIETIFLMPKDTYTYLSSRLVKEVASLGGDIDDFVPDTVALRLREKFGLASGG